MSLLFDPARHVAIDAPPWSEGEARAVIAEIAADAVGAFEPQSLWPGHPLDAPIPGGTGGVYAGAAGVVWALERLKREGFVAYGVDFAPALPRILEADKAWLGAGPFGAYASLWMGDLGPMLLQMRLAPSTGCAEAILTRARANESLPVQDMMWGTPGSMLAALWLLGATGDGAFAALYRRQVDHLLANLAEKDGVELWPFTLYGGAALYLGFAHGFAGTMFALLQGWMLLTEYQKARVQSLASATLSGTALRDAGMANWPSDLNLPETGPLVQICHGAPGILAGFAAAPFSTPEFEALLAAAAETVWAAGPLAKGSGFCHGTAGNAHALLRLHLRTGEARWLDRARAMAMAAVAQHRAERAEHGMGRHSLWTGDPGLACVLADMIAVRARFPSLDCL